MLKTGLRVFAIVLIELVASGIGLIIGALFGGNYAQQFVFNGVRGYEATGQLGLVVGALIGLISGWWYLFKRTSLPS